MIFAARTDSGVFVIDLGWGRASSGLRRVLAQYRRRHVGRPVGVSHARAPRSHWRLEERAGRQLRQGREEVPRFFGDSAYRGFGSRVGEFLNSSHRPRDSTVRVLPRGGDTSFVFGRDTLRAYAVPGHTAGSIVYLFRETLFAGDAANHGPLAGFRGALRIFSDDVTQSHASMRALFARLDSSGVRVRTLCTAHGKCAVADSALRQRVTR